MRGIIFDCDGTLVDSEKLGIEVLVQAATEQGVRITVADAFLRYKGANMADCVADLEMRLSRRLPQDFVPKVRERTAEAFRSQLRPIDGALDLVRSIDGPMCVASSGPREKIELSLSLAGLLPFFEGRIFSSYDVGHWKPDPGLFLHAAQVLGVAPQHCSVVEDSLPGIRAGLAAGMRVFAFQPSGIEPGMLARTVVIERLADLANLLASESTAEEAVAPDGRPDLGGRR
jgi:HAD superfamily hydrolase (TIGR01509 family)